MQLYNTLSRKIEEFEPINPGKIGMYTCGPTVYSQAHIGNFRTYLTADILNRVLIYDGYDVTSVMNITDVGHMRYSTTDKKIIDPIMEEAKKNNQTPQELSQHYTELFIKDREKLNILPPTELPKASEHVEEMIEIIKVLIEKGYAYEVKGDVYFRVSKFKEYGKLSGNTLDKMNQLLEAVRVSAETDKKDSADFALWKAKGDRVMEWDSPWGKGVPGWHIECTAMSHRYLGSHFDIHAGGEDLIFPHHEDEIAQAVGFSGQKFVNYWVHSTYLYVDGEKMSKSRKNVFTLEDLEAKGQSAMVFRYLTFLTHYTTRMNITWDGLDAAKTALERLYELASALGEPGVVDGKYEKKFYTAITHDLDMPSAISTVWELMRSKISDESKMATLNKFDEVLGLNIASNAKLLTTIPEEILEMSKARDHYRANRKFSLADQLRAQIEKRGYLLKDGKKNSKVVRKI